jgi:hypothetical protein
MQPQVSIDACMVPYFYAPTGETFQKRKISNRHIVASSKTGRG